MADWSVPTPRGRYLVRDHGDLGFAVVPPYSPGPPDFWADTAEVAFAWVAADAEESSRG